MTAVAEPQARLPLWRAIAGFAVLASLLGVLLAIAPVYIRNDRLSRRVKTVVAQNATASEDVLRLALLKEAKTLDLPVLPGDVKISHPSGKLEVQVKYNVHIYRVDLHFHPSATAPAQKVK